MPIEPNIDAHLARWSGEARGEGDAGHSWLSRPWYSRVDIATWVVVGAADDWWSLYAKHPWQFSVLEPS